MSDSRETDARPPTPGPGAARHDASGPSAAAHETARLPDSVRSDAGQSRDGDSPRVPSQFGRYRIVRVLGEGAMGAVYLAEDTQLQRKVALKIPKFGDRTDSRMLERFVREARLAATLRHANICPVYDSGEVDGTHFLTMAFIEGRPLAEIIRSGRRVSQRQAALLVRKLAQGLAEAHSKGVIHRDLKPANIMVNTRGEPVVTDFGLARRTERGGDEQLTRDGAIVGTPAYMSPEQVEGVADGVGPASDVYSLGVIFYELLAGQPPFRGSIPSVLAQIVSQSPPRPSALRPGIDAGLESICLQMIARSPDDRVRSMTEVTSLLTNWIRAAGKEEESVKPTDAEPPAPAAQPTRLLAGPPGAARRDAVMRPRRISRGAWIGIGLCGLGLSAWLVFMLKSPGEPGGGQTGMRPVRATEATSASSQSHQPQRDVAGDLADGETADDEKGDDDKGDVPPLTQREAAERILARGGKLSVVVPGEGAWKPLETIDALPSQAWRVVSADLSGRSLDEADFRSLQAFPSLTFLKLARTSVRDAELEQLAGLTRLNQLDLAGTAVSDEGLKSLPIVRRLNLHHTRVTGAGLAELKRMTELEFLELDSGQLDEAGVANLGKFPALLQLWCFASDAELRRLAGLPQVERLALWKPLDGAGVSDTALEVLPKFPSLVALSVVSEGVTDEGLSRLSRLSRLESLFLNTPQVSEQGLAALRGALPACAITVETQPGGAAGPSSVADSQAGAQAEAEIERTAQVLVATAGPQGAAWRYTTDTPPTGWEQPEFDDTAWSRGKGPFSKGYGRPANWSTADLWLRTEFDWTSQALSQLIVKMKHDEVTQVYLNGTLVLQRPHYITRYRQFPLSAEAIGLLRAGRNVLAVHCRNQVGGQFIDVGLLAVASPTTSSASAIAPRLVEDGHRVYVRESDRERLLTGKNELPADDGSICRIAWNELLDVSPADLELLRQLPQLRTLRLSETRLTDGAARLLSGLTQVRELDLSSSGAGIPAMNALRSHQALEWLDLTDTRLTAAQIETLRAELPACQILPPKGFAARGGQRAGPKGSRPDGGWREVFNGRDLSGWARRGGKWIGTWEVVDGAVVCSSGHPRGWLSNANDVADFQFQAEFRFSAPAARTSIVLRMPDQPKGHDAIPASGGLQVNLFAEGAGPRRGEGDSPTRQCGALDGLAAPRDAIVLSPGVWHRVAVRAVGPQIDVSINDRPAVSVDLTTFQGQFPRDAPLWRTSGQVGLANSNVPVEYRGLRLRPAGPRPQR